MMTHSTKRSKRRLKHVPGDLVKVSGVHGVVVKFLYTWPAVKAQRTSENVRDIYEVLLSSGEKNSVSHDQIMKADDA